jgi:hypothetical protein
MLGEGEAAIAAADRYRFLAQLIVTIGNDNGSSKGQVAGILRRYARWVRISLRMLAENQTVPTIHGGSPEYPVLGMSEGMPLWEPNPIPPGWNEESDVDR